MNTSLYGRFQVGTNVRIADRTLLEEFRRAWEYHHKLTLNQLQFAGHVAEVERSGVYHGGDMIYELKGIPGYWHEHLLEPV